jgi:hypothetical protein
MKLGQSHREQWRFLLDDVATEDRNYFFLYELTHITKDRGARTGRRPGGQGHAR